MKARTLPILNICETFVCWLLALLAICALPGICHALDARYRVILERNPFVPERGVGAGDQHDGGATGEASEFKGKYAVYGVVIAENEPKWAFVKPLSKKPGKAGEDGMRKITEGDLVDGWKVSAITYEGVSFVRAGKKVFLKVFGGTKKERSANKPVAIATPKARTAPAGGASSSKNRRKPGYFVAPGNKDRKEKQVNNPFLKALLDARKKQKQQNQAH